MGENLNKLTKHNPYLLFFICQLSEHWDTYNKMLVKMSHGGGMFGGQNCVLDLTWVGCVSCKIKLKLNQLYLYALIGA